jgi:hypothetical protein
MNSEQAIQHIREITELLYDAFGEDIQPEEQLDMIRRVLEQCKENAHVQTE